MDATVHPIPETRWPLEAAVVALHRWRREVHILCCHLKTSAALLRRAQAAAGAGRVPDMVAALDEEEQPANPRDELTAHDDIVANAIILHWGSEATNSVSEL